MVTISKNKIAKAYQHPYYLKKYDTPRKLENAINREYERLMAIYNTPLVKQISIDMNWSKAGNVSGEFIVQYADGKIRRGKHPSIGGGGFDKRIEMLESILNDVAKQNLFHRRLTPSDGYSYPPSGYRYSINDIAPRYCVGGRSDGKFKYYTIEHVAWGKTYDKYVINFKN